MRVQSARCAPSRRQASSPSCRSRPAPQVDTLVDILVQGRLARRIVCVRRCCGLTSRPRDLRAGRKNRRRAAARSLARHRRRHGERGARGRNARRRDDARRVSRPSSDASAMTVKTRRATNETGRTRRLRAAAVATHRSCLRRARRGAVGCSDRGCRRRRRCDRRGRGRRRRRHRCVEGIRRGGRDARDGSEEEERRREGGEGTSREHGRSVPGALRYFESSPAAGERPSPCRDRR